MTWRKRFMTFKALDVYKKFIVTLVEKQLAKQFFMILFAGVSKIRHHILALTYA